MPRVAGIYSRPTGIDAVANNTIDSGKYNSNVADVEADLNLPRPIVAGGTGATNAIDARHNIGAEVSSLSQIVTNYDAQVWESGSFVSFAGATAAPTAGSHYTGVCTLLTADQQNIVLRAVGFDTGALYTRIKTAGSWSAWNGDDVMASDLTVNGGDITINSTTNATLVLNKNVGAFSNDIIGKTTGSNRWVMKLGDQTAEGGGNAGSNFAIYRYSDTGVFLDNPLLISRATGQASITTSLVIAPPGSTAPANSAPFRIGIPAGVLGVATRPPTDASNWHFGFENSTGSIVGNISTTATNTAFATASDERLKDDLKSFDAGNIIDDTKVWSFKWRSTGERAYGVIAQQANEVYPAAITYNKEADWYGVDYSKYVPILLQEAKTLRSRIKTLEALIGTTPMATILQRLDVLDKFREKIEAL